ncbi:hypothetical protein [Lysinibacillus endophyticus]|uniref:hypothetical protein n=1 Tax=Ureibacillus endophyticus TaxID=1978490 RepID=UPI00209FB4AF|nr:hypothetical protein [Lysinibacillus endophyticus]MCP1144509.1 hypothetical protein [Lysinibacillus endophyticus]
MKESIKGAISYISLVIGLILLFIGFLYYLIITSDIPVSFTLAESKVAQGTILASTFAFLLGSLLNLNKKVRTILIGILSISFIINLSHLTTASRGAEYFTLEFVHLILSFVIQPVLIIFVNILVIINNRKKGKEYFRTQSK